MHIANFLTSFLVNAWFHQSMHVSSTRWLVLLAMNPSDEFTSLLRFHVPSRPWFSTSTAAASSTRAHTIRWRTLYYSWSVCTYILCPRCMELALVIFDLAEQMPYSRRRKPQGPKFPKSERSVFRGSKILKNGTNPSKTEQLACM